MKKISFILIFMLAMCDIVFAQQNQSTTIWKVFSSGSCDFETFEVGPVKQDFIDVKQVGNKYYWGNDNVFSLYNKKEVHDGFMSFTTYDFVDKYGKRGLFIYQYNRNADWATKHMFYICYEGKRMGMYYCSNEPKIQ